MEDPLEGATLKRHEPLPFLSIDRSSPEPLHRQVATALRSAIGAGRLTAGSVLPSTRRLSESLGVSRNTILTAYEELSADGLLSGQHGSGTRVSGLRLPIAAPDWRSILRASQYPTRAFPFGDPDGNALYFHDSQ
jgi:DNA-binding FadR family transcriptional regulator